MRWERDGEEWVFIYVYKIVCNVVDLFVLIIGLFIWVCRFILLWVYIMGLYDFMICSLFLYKKKRI